MTTTTDATIPLAAAVKGARSIGLPSANVTVHALEAAIAENGELRKRVEQLTDRVIGESTNRVDAEDLRRENAELHKMLADGVTSDAVIAKLREWTAGGRHPYEPGASYVAMPVSSACKIVAEIDRLTEAVVHLERVVGHQDDPCDFDHHGFCQTHLISGSEDGKCGTAEARAFLAAGSSR